MKMKMLLILMCILCLAVSLPLACAKPAPAPAPAPKPAPAEILLGAVCSLTGHYAAFGEGSAWGMQAAINDVNKQGGVYVKEFDQKLPLRVIIVNGESDAAKMGTLAEDLVLRDKVNFLLTSEPPDTSSAVFIAGDKYQVPVVAFCGPFESWYAMKEAAPGEWDTGFGLGPHTVATPFAAGDFRANKPGYLVVDVWRATLDLFGEQTNKKVAVCASDDPDGIAWYAGFGGMLKGLGYDAVGVDKKLGLCPAGTTDFSSIIEEWKDNNCEILWGNSVPPFFGALWRQCSALGFQPKIATIGRAILTLEDVSALGGDLPQGLCTEVFSTVAWGDSPGIGGTTPRSLHERWSEETGRGGPTPFPCMGYEVIQVVADAVERAGTLDVEKLCATLRETDLKTVMHRVKFDEHQYNSHPLVLGQWQKTDKPHVWELEVVFSQHDFVKPTAEPLFPIPYK